LSCRRESCNGSYHITCVGVTKSMLANMKKSGDIKTCSSGFCTPVSEHDGDDGVVEGGITRQGQLLQFGIQTSYILIIDV
jgi:hypothetical protein